MQSGKKSLTFFSSVRTSLPISSEIKMSPISLEKTIQLPKNTIPFYVGMYEKGKVILCNPDDNVFLFTDGLATCTAAIFYCFLKSGKKIIGVTHMSFEENLDQIYSDCQDEQGRVTAVKEGYFVPIKINKMVQQIIKCPDYFEETIYIWLAGGRDNEMVDVYQKLYCEYIKHQINLCLKGCLFNPFGINKIIERNILRNLSDEFSFSLVAGIDASGKVTAAKSFDISFDMKKDIFTTAASVEKYFKEKNLRISKNYPQPDHTIYGFSNLTHAELREANSCFVREGYCYGFREGYFVIDSDSEYFTKNKKTIYSPKQ